MFRPIAISFLLVTICVAQDNVSRMDQVVHGYTDSKLFMGSVLVARDGKVLLSKGYGFADMEWDIPNSPTTKFRLASVTKQFTAACMLLLEERGKLKLDDPVKKYLTDAPAAWDKITIFNLLTHTSGIPDYTGFYDYDSTEAIATIPEKLVARFRDRPLEFQPGEKWKYSNSGYVLLGYLIERISQQSYSQFVQENIFNPLGMKESGYDSSSAIIPHRASGYVSSPKGVINASYIDMSVPFAAGGLYSTTEDLLRWEQGLMGGKLLSPASLQQMTTPFKGNYALGVGVNTVNGHKVISHAGSVEGFYTELEYYPEDKLTVVVLANLRVRTPEGIARKLAAVAHGENVPLPTATKEITVSPAVLESYVGTYELKPSFNIVVTLEDGQLMMQATGQLKVPLFAESETEFFLKVVDAQVEFFKNEKGEVAHLMLHQNGRDIKGIKKSQFSVSYFLEQGGDHYAKGDYEQATHDFNEAIWPGYKIRGCVQWPWRGLLCQRRL
jgi:CubicO group peptidase (beta-lactamase class C family)